MNIDMVEKDIIYNNASLHDITEYMKNIKELDIKLLESDKTALVIVDMINGFTKEGNLKSERISNIIPSVIETTKLCSDKKFKILAFADGHTIDSIEFKNYPVHCLKDTSESELISELNDFHKIKVIYKNSTNGYMEKEFIKWIKKNDNIVNFIVIGNCTDICVMQFVLSLKSHFNINNQKCKVIVPIDSVETFHSESHNGDIMNLFAIYNMSLNGVNIVSKIK